MILKMKMKDDSRKNIEIIKKHFFDDNDKITAGYIIGLAVEQTTDISDDEWKTAVNNALYEKESMKSKSTSVSLRQDIYERISHIKEMLQGLCNKSLYMSQVIDVILSTIVNRINHSMVDTDSLTAFEWNLNARTGSLDYVIPVGLISNEVFEKTPPYLCIHRIC